ncbi:MAG: MBL fold metallo-hydrolase [Phenylobacterium sp.]|uniref:MBL fold metallo-hydrolase n=1 Tax=Phenylobacterium sp. TaxID=1871053 RepID=UPI00391D056C
MRARRMWSVLAGLVLVAGVAVAGLWLARGFLATRAMERIFAQAMGSDPLAELPDGLHVGLCGTGSPMPDPTRAGPCVAVVAGQRLFVVDSGSGSTRQLSLMNLPPPRVEAVFITHFHSDHIADLGELMLQRWAGGAAAAPVPVYGPEGVATVVEGFEAAYGPDRGYRIAHHGAEVVPPSGFGGEPRAFALDPTADTLVYEAPDLKVWAFPVVHHPVEPAVGYRFEYKGRSVVISGDTARSERLTRAAKGADVLLHEALAPNLVAIQRDAARAAGRSNYAAIMEDILSYHATPEQAAAEAQSAGVGRLVFYHVIPPQPVRALEGPFLGRSREIFDGPVQVARDGDFISLPAGGEGMTTANRLNTFRF